jgi:hypothetical protein
MGSQEGIVEEGESKKEGEVKQKKIDFELANFCLAILLSVNGVEKQTA